MEKFDFDYVIIGSGFGGSISALRLTEKGYKVAVIEQGKRFKAEDFPTTNWQVKKWFWLPLLKFFGIMKLTIFRRITVLSGTGVGGGSLVYANTLAYPKNPFFEQNSWSHLNNWKEILKPFYNTVLKMLGAEICPKLEIGDNILKKIAEERKIPEHFEPTKVAVYFGQPKIEAEDPFFNGEGPKRSGCTFCGGCMVGCRYNAKNTLDKNYLYLAEKKGATVFPENRVFNVIPLDGVSGESGFQLFYKSSTSWFSTAKSLRTKGIIFSAGVLGTNELLINIKEKSLPFLSPMLGKKIRTNSETLIGVTTFDKEKNFSEGIAISSILQTDEHSHVEPVRHPEGSGFWRILQTPLIHSNTLLKRIAGFFLDWVLHPVDNFKAMFIDDWAKRTQVLLFMQTIDSTLAFEKGFLGLKTVLDTGLPPTAFIPESKKIAERYAELAGGKAFGWITETLTGIPTTAHILGGCVMGLNENEGVIDKNNKVFGYHNMYICDGSTVSANPGVNPSLTISALTEHAMSHIPEKG